MWTGYLFDKDLIGLDILNYVDVIVDGQYKDELHDFRLEWKGSSNQRVIDVKKSLETKEVVIFE
jgi:anaerobic ribonucleoside-triphosphate reductase activating protein